MLVLTIGLFIFSASAEAINLNDKQVDRIGEKVFHNECSGINECLVSWNQGEDFLSLGIGHFIWYPEGRQEKFDETFTELLSYIKAKDIPIPPWLNTNPPPSCPWQTQKEFQKDLESPKVVGLREFLVKTKHIQALFLVERLNNALPILLDNVSSDKQQIIRARFESVASTPEGLFALLDYVNFKGLGILSTERYQGEGWGLLQVLLAMEDSTRLTALEQFANSARKILAQRVKNAPPHRNEHRWLPGWQRRVRSYLSKY